MIDFQAHISDLETDYEDMQSQYLEILSCLWDPGRGLQLRLLNPLFLSHLCRRQWVAAALTEPFRSLCFSHIKQVDVLMSSNSDTRLDVHLPCSPGYPALPGLPRRPGCPGVPLGPGGPLDPGTPGSPGGPTVSSIGAGWRLTSLMNMSSFCTSSVQRQHLKCRVSRLSYKTWFLWLIKYFQLFPRASYCARGVHRPV